MKNSILFCLFLSSINLGFSQTLSLDFAKAYDAGIGCVVEKIISTPSNEYIVMGYYSGTVDFDFGPVQVNLTCTGEQSTFIAKYTSQMDLIWVKQITGTGYSTGYDIELDSENAMYIYGTFIGTVDADPGPSTFNITALGSTSVDRDIFLLKISANGSFLWVRTFGSLEDEYSNCLVVSSDDNVFISGTFKGPIDAEPTGTNVLFPVGSRDFFIEKFNPAGTMIWVKQFSSTTASGFATDMLVDNSGALYFAGFFGNTVDFDPGPSTFNLTATGLFNSYIAKLSASGNLAWAYQIEGTEVSLITRMSQFSDGSLLVGGYFSGTMDMDLAAGNNLLTANSTTETFLAKYSPSGGLIWANKIAGDSEVYLEDIEIDASDNVYACGAMKGTVFFNPGSAQDNITSFGTSDAFLAKYNSSGDYLWAFQTGSFNNDYAKDIMIDQDQKLIVTGSGHLEIDFDPSPATYNLTLGGYNNSYIQKLSQNLSNLEEKENDLQIYPNPFQSNIQLKFDDASKRFITIKDATGKIIHEETIIEKSNVLDLSELNTGIYFIQSTDQNGEILRTKLMKN